MGLIKRVGLGVFFEFGKGVLSVGAGKGSFWSVVHGLGVSLFRPAFCRPGDG